MSALGHKRTFAVQKGMSALPPKADMCGATRDVRFVPIADFRRQQNLGEKKNPPKRARIYAGQNSRLLGSLERGINVMSRLSDWRIVGVAQFIRRERSDLSHLIYSELVRQRSGFNAEGDRFTAFIDSVCAEVSNRP